MIKAWIAMISCVVALLLAVTFHIFKWYFAGLICAVIGVVAGLILWYAPGMFQESRSYYDDPDVLNDGMIRISGGLTVLLCGISGVFNMMSLGMTILTKSLEAIL